VLSQVFPDLPVHQRVLLEEGIRQGEMLNHFKAGGGEAEVKEHIVGEVGLMFARAYGMCARGSHTICAHISIILSP